MEEEMVSLLPTVRVNEPLKVQTVMRRSRNEATQAGRDRG
jgi:hypothetical protein